MNVTVTPCDLKDVDLAPMSEFESESKSKSQPPSQSELTTETKVPLPSETVVPQGVEHNPTLPSDVNAQQGSDAQQGSEQPARSSRLRWMFLFVELAQSSLLIELIATPVVICFSQSSWLSYFIGIWMVRHLFVATSLVTRTYRLYVRVLVELITLAWFILGVVWLFMNAQTEIAHEPVFLYSAYLIVLFFAPEQGNVLYYVNLCLGAVIVSCVNVCRRSQNRRDLKKILRQLSHRVVTDADLTDSPTCAICLNNFVTGEQRIKLHCQHWFHPQCVQPWLEQHGTCPLCRHSILSPECAEPGNISPLQNQNQNQNPPSNPVTVSTDSNPVSVSTDSTDSHTGTTPPPSLTIIVE